LTKEALSYIAGYIAFKLKNEHPDLGTKTSESEVWSDHDYCSKLDTSFMWISKLSQGGLMKPSQDFLSLIRSFEEEFERFHSGKLAKRKKVISSFIQLLHQKYPETPLPIIKKFARTRSFIRMKELNKKLTEFSFRQRNKAKTKHFQN
jgi:hypothetical protein